MSNKLPTLNNFNFIRLLAALQVCIIHTLEHLKIGLIIPIITYFPGVIIFFTVSGFLIFDSFTRNQQLKRYFRNRILRIFPALWVSLLLTVILLLIFKIILPFEIISPAIFKWIISQLTIFQFWTPEILRKWGVGTPNGSLWTIPVEIQFYIILPIIVLAFKKIKILYKLFFLFTISISFNLFLHNSDNKESLIIKLIGVSVLPYLFYFIIGIIIRKYWEFLNVFLINKFIYWLSLFLIFIFVFQTTPQYFPKEFNGFMINLILAFATISFAFSKPNFDNIFRGQDISYGIYIFHMLVVNCLVSLGYLHDFKYFILSISCTVFLSLFSWNYIERPFLMYKNN